MPDGEGSRGMRRSVGPTGERSEHQQIQELIGSKKTV